MRVSARQLGALALALLPAGLVVLPQAGRAEPASAEVPTRVYADAFTVWIYERPERSVTPIGMLRAGQSLLLRAHEGHPPHQRVARGCGKGWYAVEPAGFVCLDHQLSLSPTRYSRSMAQLLPRPGAHPFDYALSMGTPSYRRLPSEDEWRRRERKYGAARPRPLPPHWRGHEELVGDVPLPAGGLSPFLEEQGSVSRLPEGRLRRREVPFGSMLALSGAFDHEGRRFGQSADGTIVGLDRMRVFRRSSFKGIELSPGAAALPVAWTRRKLATFRLAERAACQVPLRGAAASGPRGSGAGHTEGSDTRPAGTLGPTVELPLDCLEKTASHLSARSLLHLDTTPILIAGTSFLRYRASQEADGAESLHLVPRDALFLAEQHRAPRPIREADAPQKWIHFSIAQGTLTAYRGSEPWYATLASPGIGGVPQPGADPLATRTTPVGTYRIHFKYVTDDMSPEVGEHRSFWIADVPYAMYFKQPFAIHVAYWHESFGEPMSGGCINVSPRDGARLFDFADPPLPDGWYGVGASQATGHGTWVVVERN